MKEIIIAGNYRQYKDYLRENNKSPVDSVFINDPIKLRGLRDVKVIETGEYWLNKAYNDPYLAILKGGGI